MKEFKIDDKTFRRINLPILVDDDLWLGQLDTFNNESIEEKIGECRKLLKQEEELEKQQRTYLKEKKLLMEKILGWSDEVNQNDDVKAERKLEKARERVLELNTLLDDLQFELEMIPKEVTQLNEALFHETIFLIYTYITSGKERVGELDVEIQDLRKQLGEHYAEKFDIENRVESVYKYLHQTLGKDETNHLDETFLENKEDGREK